MMQPLQTLPELFLRLAFICLVSSVFSASRVRFLSQLGAFFANQLVNQVFPQCKRTLACMIEMTWHEMKYKERTETKCNAMKWNERHEMKWNENKTAGNEMKGKEMKRNALQCKTWMNERKGKERNMQMETDAARHETTTNWRQMKWEENYINWFEMTMKKNENKMKRKEIKRICVSSINDWRWHDYNWLELE